MHLKVVDFIIIFSLYTVNLKITIGFLAGSVAKNLPADVGDTVQSLGQADPLEKGMATHSGILA